MFISFSTLVPNLGKVLFFLILWYPFFHRKGKQNLLSGKQFYPSVPQWHLVLPSNISWSVCTLKSPSILHLSFSITVSGSCLYHFSFTSIPYFSSIKCSDPTHLYRENKNIWESLPWDFFSLCLAGFKNESCNSLLVWLYH